MMQLTSRQFQQFVDRANSAELERICRLLLTACPELALSKVAVGAGIDHAHRFGIADEAQVVRFLALRARHGEGFDAEPWARPLWSAEPDGSRRLDAVEALLQRGR